MNNSIINPINVRDGHYYYFVQPYTEYKLYSLNSTNNTLKLIDTISNKNITSGNSYRNVIFSDELFIFSMYRVVFTWTVLPVVLFIIDPYIALSFSVWK